MANRDVRVDEAAAPEDRLEGGAGSGSVPSDGGSPSGGGASDTHGVPSAGGDDEPAGSEDPPPSGGPDDDELGDPKHVPPTVAEDGGVGGDGPVGAGGSGSGGNGGLFGGVAEAVGDVADAAEDAYDQGEDLANDTYDDVEDEVAETYEDASKLDHSGEHWGGVAGTPDEAVGAVLDTIDPDHRLEEFNRDAGDAIDGTARAAGDAFRDAGDVVDEAYDDSGVGAVIADAREAGAVVVPDVVEDVYDQGEDLAHQTYGDVEDEVVQTYEDLSTFETDGEHWGGLAGTPDHWLDPVVDGAENVAETPGDWYEKSGVGEFGAGADGGAAAEGDVPGAEDFGRGDGNDSPDPFSTDEGLLRGAEETAELAGEEGAQEVIAEVGDLTADPGPIEVPHDTFEASELTPDVGAPELGGVEEAIDAI